MALHPITKPPSVLTDRSTRLGRIPRGQDRSTGHGQQHDRRNLWSKRRMARRQQQGQEQQEQEQEQEQEQGQQQE
jgi:hypothetical protein